MKYIVKYCKSRQNRFNLPLNITSHFFIPGTMERFSNKSVINKLRKSYYNVFAFFLMEQDQDQHIMSCLIKWGVALNIHKIELLRIKAVPTLLTFEKPATTSDALEQIYDLLFLTNMDGVVEDVELEVITQYSRAIGIAPYVVNNLLKALVSASYDGVEDNELRNDIKQHPEVYV